MLHRSLQPLVPQGALRLAQIAAGQLGANEAAKGVRLDVRNAALQGAYWRPADGETAADLARLKASSPTPRDAVAYIMDTFPIVRRKDEAKFDGDYRTRRVILDIYDALAESIRTGQPYQTRLDPPPADPRCCHLPRAAMPQYGHDGAAGTGAQQPTALQSVS